MEINHHIYVAGSSSYSFIGNVVKSGTGSITIAAPARYFIFSDDQTDNIIIFFVPIKITDATIILSKQVVLKKSCVAKSIKCGSTLVKPNAVPLKKNQRLKLRVYTSRSRILIYENASDDLRLAERILIIPFSTSERWDNSPAAKRTSLCVR